ncbi:MAG TPA: hypothetical protein ENI23_08140 [bacterium]|nr:hypothetical protein [bacterium]
MTELLVDEKVIKDRQNQISRNTYTHNNELEKVYELRFLYGKLIGCTACAARKECIAPVSGAGNVSSKIVLVGRNPGRNEDAEGVPFIGKGGDLLNQFIKWVGLDREYLFITNALKCFTEDNRVPTTEEVNLCGATWLTKELNLLKPKLIITFGAEACRLLTNFDYKTATMKLHQFADNSPLSKSYIICCTHPGACLRNSIYADRFRTESYFVKAQIKALRLLP